MFSKKKIQSPSLRFRGWRRKSYAAFHSIGKHITIGKVKGVVADTLLRKQNIIATTTKGITIDLKTDVVEAPEEPTNPPSLQLALLAPVVCRKKTDCETIVGINDFIYSRRLKVAVQSLSAFLFFTTLITKQHMKKVWITLIGCILFKGLYAQEQTLDPVTITSSLIEKRSSETGRNITILSGESIASLPVHSLDELLRYLPGIEVQSRGPQGAQSDISLRGGTFQQILIILDGLRINDPNTGHFTAYIPITPAQIERIEVLKGASAAVYGADAVGGVINIITKTAQSASNANAQAIHARVGAGAHHLVNTNVGGFYKKDRLIIDAGVLSNHSTGVPQRGINGFFHNTSASAGIGYQLNDYWRLSARTALDRRHFAAQNFYTTFASDTATERVNSWWHQLQAHYKKNRSELSLNVGYKKLDDTYAYNSAASPNQNTSKLLQALLLYQQKLGENTSLVTGFNFQNKSIISNDRGDHSLNTAAPFAGLIQKIGPQFNLMPSLRIEWIGSHNAEILPQLNASYHIQNLQLRASGGRTIRDADFTERYSNYNKPLVTSGSIGNPGLIPETAWTYEAGFDWFFKSRLKLSTTFFQRFHSKLIDWVNTTYEDMPRKDNLDPSGMYALAKNIAEVNTSGFETDIRYLEQFAENHHLTLNAGMVWLYSKSTESAPSFYISSHAKFLGNFNAVYTVGNLTLSFTGLYKNRNPQEAAGINAYVNKDYFVLNGSILYHILPRKLGIFFQADNIFNRQYSDLLGSVMPGRWLQGGIQCSLK